MGKEEAHRRAKAGRVSGSRHGLDLASFETRWMTALGAVGVLTVAGWTTFALTADAKIHRLSVGAELQEISRELADHVDGDALAREEQVEALPQLERLQQLHGYAAIEPAVESPHSANVMSDVASATPSVLATKARVSDTFGQTAGFVRVTAPSQRPLLHRVALTLMHVALSGGVVGLLLKLAHLAIRSHARALAALAEGRPQEAVGRWSSRDVCSAAVSVDKLMGNGESPIQEARDDEDRAQAPPIEQVELAATSRPAHEVPFQPRRLIEDAVERMQARARRSQNELTVFVAEQLPERVVGHSVAIANAMRMLLEQALASTKGGSVMVRVSPDATGTRLRFEVRDTGAGLTVRQQDDLRRELAHTERLAPEDAPEGIQRACALAASMGGKLDFDSHAGAGSRVWFTVPYQTLGQPGRGLRRTALEMAA